MSVATKVGSAVGSSRRRRSESERSGGAAVAFSTVSESFVLKARVVDAVAGINIDVAPGEFVSLVGPSGCGKTTLLNMVAGLVKPTTGSVLYDGEPVDTTPSDVAYMFARDALLPWRSALENVELGLHVRGVAKQKRREIALEWLDRVHLGDVPTARVSELSQGMRQRVAIARTLALEPRCVLMDEPFAALDAQTRLRIQQQFVSLWERSGATVLFVTHDMQEAVTLSDRVVLMGDSPGRVLLDVTIDLDRPRKIDSIQGDPRWLELNKSLQDALRGLSVTGPPAVGEEQQ